MIHASCSFRPVGQGCFYTAAIGQREDEWSRRFRFVYDCGSSSGAAYIDRQCHGYADASRSEVLHALVISHFDADHVNGLDTLLSRFTRTLQVFIPYMSPVERLLCALRFENEAAPYYEFLADPVLFLQSRGVAQVTIVSSGGDSDGNEEPPPDATPPPDGPFEGSKFHGGEFDPGGARIFLQEGSTATAPGFITDRKSVSMYWAWKFRFFNERRFEFDLSSVAKCEEVLLSTDERTGPLRMRNFLTRVRAIVGGFDTKAITYAVSHEKIRRELREAYGEIRSVHNEVSLVLWHGPCIYPSTKAFTLVFGYNSHGRIHEERYPSAGTMLTGDVSLKGRALDSFKKHYVNQLPQTAAFYLPHHGSGHSWQYGAAMPNGHAVYVVSAGRNNSYGHPDRWLLYQLRAANRSIFWSREDQAVELVHLVVR